MRSVKVNHVRLQPAAVGRGSELGGSTSVGHGGSRRSGVPGILLQFDATKESMVGADSVIHRVPQPGTGDAVMARAEQCDGHVQHVRGGISTRYWSCRHGLQWFHHGYAWSPELITPEYLPVDEDTSLGFVDPYALSKDLGERIGQTYARLGMSVIALRLHWIMTEQELRQRRGTMDGAGGNRNLWGLRRAHRCGPRLYLRDQRRGARG